MDIKRAVITAPDGIKARCPCKRWWTVTGKPAPLWRFCSRKFPRRALPKSRWWCAPGAHSAFLAAVLDNALQASPPGTSVQVVIQTVRHPAQSNETSPAPAAPATEQRFIQIQVRDQGPGLSEKAQQHLFEPFFTTKDIGQGTGLGLAAAYGGLKQIGGWIEVCNTPEGGCAATIYLPLASDPQ